MSEREAIRTKPPQLYTSPPRSGALQYARINQRDSIDLCGYKEIKIRIYIEPCVSTGSPVEQSLQSEQQPLDPISPSEKNSAPHLQVLSAKQSAPNPHNYV